MRSSSPKLARLLGAGEAAARLATPTELRSALQARATVVDIRRAGESAEVVDGSVSATWADGALPLDKLPTETDAPLVVHCMGGVRVKAAASYLADRGYTNVINGGGPNTDLWSEYDTSIFVQLFDGPPPEGTGSSTFTYLVHCVIQNMIEKFGPRFRGRIRALGRLGPHLYFYATEASNKIFFSG